MNQPSVSNRRTSARRPLRLLCEAVRERNFTRLGHVALDLSSTGMLLRTSSNVLTGEAVFVSFFEPMQGRWYDLEATVARVVHARRKGDKERGVAIEFTSIAGEARDALEHALNERTKLERKPRATA